MRKEDLIRKLKKSGFSENIIKAFEIVERKKFIPEKYTEYSYEDTSLPIGFGQTISQPYTIAFMLGLLDLENEPRKLKILEVGSGSGYVLEMISELKKDSDIYGVEIIPELVEISKELLKNKKNLRIFQAEKGKLGLPKESKNGKFDRILVSAGSSRIPQKLLQQLRIGGILVAPVRGSITKIKKFANENKIEEYPGFIFVPLIDN